MAPTLVLRHQAPEQSMTFVIRPCRKVKRVRSPGPPAIAKLKRPKALNAHRTAAIGFQESLEIASIIKCHNCAAAKIPDQQLATVTAKVTRRERDTPR